MIADSFACRSCGSTVVADVISLGEMPLVNTLVESPDTPPDRRYPLDVVRCTVCTLVQITEQIAPEDLFRNYSYLSSYSRSFLDHAQRFAAERVERMGLDESSLVVEAASNDGYLLQFFAEQGVRVLGIEPARNIALVAQEKGVATIDEFLTLPLAEHIVATHGHARLVVANNVLAHVPDPGDFVAALASLAGPDGLVSVEVPYLRPLVDRAEFDTIYHEHLSYFSATALWRLFSAQGLRIAEIQPLAVHGGSIRIFADQSAEPDHRIESLLAEEASWGVDSDVPFATFRAAVDQLRQELRRLVMGLSDGGATIAAYGAAAKGVILANSCQLDAELIRFVADRSLEKQGKLLPGVRIPITSPAQLVKEQPDFCVLFAWNLTDEILSQEAVYGEMGGRFIRPIPYPTVL